MKTRLLTRCGLAGLALLALAASCKQSGNAGLPTPSPSASPSPAASTPVSADNVTETWLFGTDNEPSPGPVFACYPRQTLNLSQTGTSVSGQVQICGGPCFLAESLTGSNQHGQVQLSGTAMQAPNSSPGPVTYLLTFNNQTQHLTGTRNGQPYWAAPWQQPTAAQQQQCGPAPL